MSDGEAEPPWSGPVQRETAQWEREKILHEEKEEGGGWLGRLGNSCDWVADSATRDTARK